MTEQSQEDSAIDTSTATPIEEANTTDPVINEKPSRHERRADSFKESRN